jgi:hypothetical protein
MAGKTELVYPSVEAETDLVGLAVLGAGYRDLVRRSVQATNGLLPSYLLPSLASASGASGGVGDATTQWFASAAADATRANAAAAGQWEPPAWMPIKRRSADVDVDKLDKLQAKLREIDMALGQASSPQPQQGQESRPTTPTNADKKR